MRNFLLFLVFGIFSMNILNAQYINVDFEPGGIGDTWTWEVAENADNPPLLLIPNPVQVGINNSAFVQEFTARQSGAPWALVFTTGGMEPFQFDATNSTVSIMVYKSTISDVGIKFEDGFGGFHEITKPNTLINEWEEIPFDFSPVIGNTYNRLVIIPDFTWDPRPSDNIVLFDNIVLPAPNVTPPATVDVTFLLNTALITPDPTGIFIGGGNQFGGPSDNQMSDPDMDGVYEITMTVAEGVSDHYTFLNGNWGWGAKEDISGQPCADPASYNDRTLPALYENTTIMACFGSCEDDGTCPAPPVTVDVTFCVDMSCLPSATAPSVFGSFNGWCANCNLLSDPDGDGIYCTTIAMETGDHSYKFFNQEEGPESLSSPEHDACTIYENGYTNRILTVVEGEPMSVMFGWESCTPECSVPPFPAEPAPDPDCDPADVISLFSNVYMDVPVDTWLTPWSNSGFEDVQVLGNDTKHYFNLGFAGIETVGPNSINASEMLTFNLDIWNSNMTTFRVKLVDFGPDNVWNPWLDDTEYEVTFTSPAQETWTSIEIPLTEFLGMNFENISQIIISCDPGGAGDVFVDNMYFSTCCDQNPCIANFDGPTISDPCECAGGGAFDEEVIVYSQPGEVWTVSANSGYINPFTGQDFTVGYILTELPGTGGGTCSSYSDLIISGAFDGPLTGGIPKGVELYAVNDILDLSLYGIGSANNGGGTDGQEFTFPAVSITAGTYIYVASEATAFTSFFGFAPDYTSGSMGINGDDAIELFYLGGVVDVFGDINVDGTGQPWDYVDSWAYKTPEAGSNGSFNIADWTFGGPNIWDGETTNGTAASPMPIATYTCTPPATGTGIYTLVGQHLDSQGYTLSVQGGPVGTTPIYFLTISNECWYPVPHIDNLPPEICFEGEAIALTGSGMLGNSDGGPANMENEIWAGTGMTGNIFDPAGLVPATYDISYTFDAVDDDPNQHHPGCAQTIVQEIQVLPLPDVPDVAATLDVCMGEITMITPTPPDAGGEDNGGNCVTNSDLIITGAYDGPLSGGIPKGVELYVVNDIPDLSIYGIGSANNGGGSDGEEFTFPATSAPAGLYIYVASESTGFTTFFGFAPDFVSGAMSINGDDAIELFRDGSVVDLFGDINVDGNGTPWEYLDSWAYRLPESGGDITFNVANWTFGGANVWDGETTNATAASPMPIGTYTCTPPPPSAVLYNFYEDVDLTVLLAGGVLEYDPGTTVGTSPMSIWVTAVDEFGCESLAVEVVITVWAPAVAIVGENVTSCGLPGVIAMSALANYPGEWTTNGLGTIASPTSMTTSYSPVDGDIGTTVTLTWTTFNEVCGDESASMGVLIIPETPSAEFSYDQSIYSPNDGDPVLSHIDGIDGFYTYETIFCGPELDLDGSTGAIDKGNSDSGIYAVSNRVQASGNLIITGVIDGPLSGGLPKAVELYALADITDLSTYGISGANNGNGSTGSPEFVFPAESILAGEYIWIATDLVQFNNFFGFEPSYVNGVAPSINGDDAIELFCNGQIIDVFGEVDVDGSNQAWEYLDGWAYRVDNTDLDGEVFRIEHWTFSGPNALDGAMDNGSSQLPFPIGSYGSNLSGVCADNLHTVELEIYPEIVCPINQQVTLNPGLCSDFVVFDPLTFDNECYGEVGDVVLTNDVTGEEIAMDELYEVTLYDSPYSFTYTHYIYEDGFLEDVLSCSFTLAVSGYPTPVDDLACNDEIQISLDSNCEINMNADKFLEGGPYECYNQFEVYVDAPGFEDINVSNLNISLDPGVYEVTVVDAATGNFCNTIMVVEDKLAPIVLCETCPEGGILPYAGIITQFSGELTDDDTKVDLLDCWDFDFGPINNQQHPVDEYIIQVDVTGEYFIFVDSDWNDAELAIYDQAINYNDPCEGVIGGGNDNGPIFEPEVTITLEAGVNYYIGVSNYSAFQLGGYILGFSSNAGNVYNYGAPIYAEECIIEGCDTDLEMEDLPIPEVIENCGYDMTFVDELIDGPLCGTQFLKRTFTVTDNVGMTSTCVQEYYFTGTGLDNLSFPSNYDGLPGNYPKLECSDEYPLDANGNPDPSYTGYPYGYDDLCGTVEVFYNDRNYSSDCGPKILRDWTVIDDCKGQIIESTQIIRITDSQAPILDAKAGLMRISTTGWSCNADYVVPAPEHFYDNCDENPQYYVGASSGTVWQDPNTGIWYVFDLPIGIHSIFYYGVDWCGNATEAELTVEVFDGIPPIAVCEQFKQASLTFDGFSSSAKIYAEDFDSGSHDAGCGQVWLKVLRNDLGCPDYNGDDKPGGGNDIWYDDYVMYCCEDAGTEVMTTLRVFDVDPGDGPVSPGRMASGGDLYGHYNDCWTLVTVEEKAPPTIFCEDKYVSCEEDFDPYVNPNLGEPAVLSVCGNYDLEYSDNLSGLDVCGVGKIVRTWTVFVDGEDMGSCKQTIFVSEGVPFDPLTIVFPYITSMECLADPTGGEPTWEQNPCNVVGAEIVKIDTFQFVDDACYKILIEWAVIDWCVYEANTGAEDNVDEFRYISGNKRAILDPAAFSEEDRDGYYKFTEVLMVYDNTPANIVTEDYCLPTETCLTAPQVHVLEARAVEDDEDCGGIYGWQYVIHDMSTWAVVQYSYNNEEYIQLGEGVKSKSSKDELVATEVASLTIIPSLAIGNYRVLWTLNDGCANTMQAYQYFEVADKKPPTPFMVDISTALMTDCMIEVWAITFDKGACDDDCLASYDNCSEILYFTFTPMLPLIDATWSLDEFGLYYFNPVTGAKSNRNKYLAGEADAWDPVNNTSGRIYTWDHENGELPPAAIEISVYVWDQFALNEDCDDGNYDFAVIYLTINFDEADCNPGGAIVASGALNQVETEEMVHGVVVNLDGDYSEFPKHVEADGIYSFDGLASGNYGISAEKNDDYSNGVSTLDLILIQKHLLGVKPFDNVYDYIASDANGNGSISAADLFEFRKLILGVNDELSGGKSWTFIERDYAFISLNNPWQELNQAELISLSLSASSLSNNFHGIKMGDINGSAKANVNAEEVEGRSRENVSLEIEEMLVESGMIEVPVYAGKFVDVYGMQMTLSINGMSYAGVESGALNITDNNFGLLGEGTITMSWNNVNGELLEEGELLFTLKFNVEQSSRISEMISIGSKVTKAEAYVGEELAINGLELEIRGEETPIFTLYQNEPNPFAKETMIGFDLPQADSYELKIYDLTGKLLKSINAEGEKGFNSVTIDSESLNAGVMYYQLESGDHNATMKMIIIK